PVETRDSGARFRPWVGPLLPPFGGCPPSRSPRYGGAMAFAKPRWFRLPGGGSGQTAPPYVVCRECGFPVVLDTRAAPAECPNCKRPWRPVVDGPLAAG